MRGKKLGRKRRNQPEIPEAKLLRLMAMVKRLHQGKCGVDELAELIGHSYRTVYRYITLLESVGIHVEEDFDCMFFIASDSCFLCNAKRQIA